MKVCVRRVNEWDAPGMLKVYSECIAQHRSTCEKDPPPLWEYVRRVGRYTYDRGWTLCDADGWCVGFAVARECLDDPDCPFLMDVEVYVAESHRRLGVGRAVLELICSLAEMGNKRAVLARFPQNPEVQSFFESCGFSHLRTDRNFRPGEDWTVLRRSFCVPDVDRPTKPFLVPQQDYEDRRLELGRTISSATEVL